MIVLQAEARAALGLHPSITVPETAKLMLAMQSAQAAVYKFLKYDPEQRVGPAEYYPRNETLGDLDYSGRWDSNLARTKLVFETGRGLNRHLQLARIPIRAVSSLKVDTSAKFGQQSGDFGSGSDWTQGVEYAVEWDESGVCRSGMLVASGAWPTENGTVLVTYRAGYSPEEFAGPASASAVASDGTITTAGVDASPIKAAMIYTIMAKYHTLAAWSKSSLTGLLVPGPKSSENLGDYSYSLASGASAAAITGMGMEIPPEASQLLEDFQHYGLMSLG